MKKYARHRAPRVPRVQKNETPEETQEVDCKPQTEEEMKEKNARVRIVAQEIKFARLLSMGDVKIRNKALKRLKKWLLLRSQSSFEFTETDFMYLWKGLFYCMWLSDRMLVQEELAEELSKIVHIFKALSTIVLYTSCALKTLETEWFGLDQYKMNKFYMLLRRILRQTFIVCKDRSWDMEWVTKISGVFEKLFVNPRTDLGFNLRIIMIYMEELAKVSEGDIPEDAVNEFVKPFVIYIASSNDERVTNNIVRHIFRYLIYQSDVGMDYTEKFEAWKHAGFPCVNIDDMEKMEVSEDENLDDDEEPSSKKKFKCISKTMDPRAGRVDVELPQLLFNAKKLAETLEQNKSHPSSTSRARRQIRKLIEQFNELAEGRMPLGKRKVRKPYAQKNNDNNSKTAALRLIQFQKDSKDKLSKKQKEKKKKREVINFDIPSFDNSGNEDISDLYMDIDAIDSENDSIGNVAMTTKTKMRNSNADIPSRKRKRTISIHDDECAEYTSEIAENKKEKSKISKSKIKKMKFNRESDTHAADKNAKRKKKTTAHEQASSESQCKTSVIASFSQKQKPKKTNNMPITKKSKRNNHVTTELSNTLKKQLEKSSSAKKKVVFGLYRNTAQHTSEYLQQVRKSPAIPFDANKKPLASVLKMSPLPSPINPFYKKLAIYNQRI